MLFNDARAYQILFLTLFLSLGMATRDWTLQPIMIIVAIATCIGTQWILSAVEAKTLQGCNAVTDTLSTATPKQAADGTAKAGETSSFFLRSITPFLSPLITALGLSLLLRVDHVSTMALAGAVAIASKFLLKVRGKHLFNPANFGIIVMLTLTHDAWVSPGQWGEEGWYVLLFLGAGGLVLQRVGRWDTTAAFLATYVGLEAIRNVWLGWTWDVWGHRLMSGSLLLFSLFMITDPRTIPDARVARLIWAVAIALLTFILRNVFFVPTAVLWALFALAPLVPLLDILFPAPRFLWSASPPPLLPPSPSLRSLFFSPMLPHRNVP